MDILITKVGDEDRALAGERVKEFEHHFLLSRPRIGKEEVDLIDTQIHVRIAGACLARLAEIIGDNVRGAKVLVFDDALRNITAADQLGSESLIREQLRGDIDEVGLDLDPTGSIAEEVLDQIIDLYVEQDCSAQSIIDQGFAEADVHRAVRLIDLNEYKRRQAPIGVRLTRRGFGRDRRYPITSKWKPGV